MYERATVVINTSGLCFRKQPDLKAAAIDRWSSSAAVPNKIS